MKRLTERRKHWLKSRAFRELRKRKKRDTTSTLEAENLAVTTFTSKFPPPAKNVPPAATNLGRGQRRRQVLFIKPPEVFSLRRNFVGVASFFQHLRHQIYRDNFRNDVPRAVAFEALQSVSASAALVLAAELFRWQKFTNTRLIAVKQERWNPAVAHVLRSMGLFDFLRTPNLIPVENTASNQGDLAVIKYRSDVKVVGTACDDLLAHLTEIAGPLNAGNFIYDGLVEALKNSHQHAYSDPKEWFGVPPGTWFMSGSYNRTDKRLTAAVYDHGIGIPRTLPRSTIWEQIRHLIALGKSDDGQMISAAMEFGRTRTDLPGRGNGLPTMMRILDHHQGYLRIVSGTGEAIYDSVNQSIKAQNFPIALGGTLIEWSIAK